MAYGCLGLVHLAFKNYELAISELDKAISENPDRAELFNARGIAHEETRHPELALKDYTQAITIDPKSAVLYHNRGTFYVKLGDNQKAIDDLKTFLSLSLPGDEGRKEVEELLQDLENR